MLVVDLRVVALLGALAVGSIGLNVIAVRVAVLYERRRRANPAGNG